MGKCKGDFDPLESLRIRQLETGMPIELEEAFCLDMCKKGPNVRLLVNNKIAQVEGMTEIEISRKAFNGVSNEVAVSRVWDLAQNAFRGQAPIETFVKAADGRYLKSP